MRGDTIGSWSRAVAGYCKCGVQLFVDDLAGSCPQFLPQPKALERAELLGHRPVHLPGIYLDHRNF
jgi:hypothetical protein